MLVLQNFTAARKSGNIIFFDILKAFSKKKEKKSFQDDQILLPLFRAVENILLGIGNDNSDGSLIAEERGWKALSYM